MGLVATQSGKIITLSTKYFNFVQHIISERSLGDILISWSFPSINKPLKSKTKLQTDYNLIPKMPPHSFTFLSEIPWRHSKDCSKTVTEIRCFFSGHNTIDVIRSIISSIITVIEGDEQGLITPSWTSPSSWLSSGDRFSGNYFVYFNSLKMDMKFDHFLDYRNQ